MELIHVSAGPLPVIEGVAAPAPVTSAPRQPAPIATLSTPLPPLAPADRAKFLNVYNKANPVNGLVSGEAIQLCHTTYPC